MAVDPRGYGGLCNSLLTVVKMPILADLKAFREAFLPMGLYRVD